MRVSMNNRNLFAIIVLLMCFQEPVTIKAKSFSPYFGNIIVEMTNESVLATSIFLNKSSAEIKQGETMQLTATVLPFDASNKNVIWTSSNSTVANVNSSGFVTAKSIGNAIITASTTDGSNLSTNCTITVIEDYSLDNGEWATLDDGAPDKQGQTTNDHLFVRGNSEIGIIDNVVSFWSGSPQIVWFWLDDDEIYLNEKVQALPPTLIKDGGSPYNEITYSCLKCDIYLPAGIKFTKTINDDGDYIDFLQGDRMPNSAILSCSYRGDKQLDGFTYQVYTVIISNPNNNGTHFSSKNAMSYQSHGALKKDDAPLFGMLLMNENQNMIEGRLADMIIANQEFGVLEAIRADWEPNDYRFIFGMGGNNESQCFQKYNRVALFGSTGIDFVEANGIYLSDTCKSLYVNDTFQLTATVTPANTTNKSVTWKSSNNNVATIDSKGNVKAISPGSAIISATTTDGSNLSATCALTVKQQDILATSISMNKTSLMLGINESFQLEATVYPSNTTNNLVNWYSSNNEVATVSASGLVRAIAKGSATITATTTDGSNLSASCEVTVSIIPVSSLSLNKTNLTLDVDDTYQLLATITPSNATYKTLSWTSSNPAIATVSDNGLVTPVSPGEATITATTTDGTNLSASCQVTVVKRIKSITLNETSITLTLPQTTQLVAFITPDDATNQTLTWTSSNTSVATVDANGFVTSKAVGTTTIKATTKDGSNLSASCQVTVVKQYVTSITLNESSLVMHIGDTFQLIADVQPDNASNPSLSWSTGNSSVASVDNNGLVTAKAGGTTYVRASATDGSNRYANCTIEVLPDYYITLDTLSHIRGVATQIVDLPVTLVNKNPISGIQFDISLPSDVEFNLVDSLPDVWLDEARATRTHSITASQLSNGKYRVLVTSSASRDLRGNDGELVHMNMLLPQQHDTGNRYINITNIIASEADETRHILDNKSTVVHFYYIVGDADANAVVDIADHAATASKILGKTPSPFFYDAANVDANNSLDVVDLVGITNIALGIKPITIRQAPRRGGIENRLFCDKLNLNAGGEKEITVGIDCGFDFAGFQMDVKLPNGLTLIDASLSDEAAKLSLATETMPYGTIRFLGTSFSDAVVNGVCPQLLTLRLKAERNYQSGTQLEFSDILFAERDLTAHYFDGSFIEYVEPCSVYELMDDARICVEYGNIIVDTPVAGTVQLIAVDGRMIEYQANVGHNVYPVDASGIYIIHFLNKTIKVYL